MPKCLLGDGKISKTLVQRFADRETFLALFWSMRFRSRASDIHVDRRDSAQDPLPNRRRVARSHEIAQSIEPALISRIKY